VCASVYVCMRACVCASVYVCVCTCARASVLTVKITCTHTTSDTIFTPAQDDPAIKGVSAAYGNIEVHGVGIITNTDDVCVLQTVYPESKSGDTPARNSFKNEARGVPKSSQRAHTVYSRSPTPIPPSF